MMALLLRLSVLTTVIAVSLASPEFDLPIARIYQVDSNNKVLRPWTRIDGNSETTVENVDNLRLDCIASYPVQWIYTGNGIPVYTTANKYSRKNTHGETSSEYSATLLINPLKEHHTGKYQCSPGEFIDGRTFFYIYVPGSTLFTSLNGHTIVLPKNDTNILIPCTVSNPKASVTLDKSEGDVLRRVKVRSSDAVQYDPKEGFRLKTDKIDNPEGTYVCSAKYGSYSRVVEYQVKSYRSLAQSDSPANLKKCNKECGENAYCDLVDGREACKCNPEFNGDPDLKCVIKCNAHTDCPLTHSCFVDRQCRDPCTHSLVGCGVNAKCKVENHRPVCYCPEGWVGDETIQCFNEWQGSESDRSKPQSDGRSTIKCGSNTECSYNETCTRITKTNSDKFCIDPCITRKCGKNAECLTEEHRASCQCLKGFEGDARIECYAGKQDSRPAYAEPLRDGPRDNDFPSPCRRPEECGPHSECRMQNGNQQCLCKQGYLGQPPKCQAECKANKDCPEKHVCLADTRIGYPSCSKICGSKICGPHSDCLEFDGGFECYCPDGLYGDPLIGCETKEDHLNRDCTVDYDCGTRLRCETGRDYRKCVDPCDKLNCRDEFVCEVSNHNAKCVCPRGYTGNSYVGCTKNFDLSSTTPSACRNISCGKNSECRVIDGNKPICVCQSGFIGRPPACISECFSNSDCPNDLTCISKRCRHSCSGCGKNTRCRVAPNLSRDSVCSCLDGYEGNPYTGCTPLMRG